LRSEKEILDAVVNWASEEKDVRAVIITSSRANPNALRDIFTDYDIEFAVTDIGKYLSHDSWLYNFGEPIEIIKEDEQAFNGEFAMRMVIYADYIKIDFRIHTVVKFHEQILKKQLPDDWDIGCKVLIDKDSMTADLKKPTFNAFTIAPPSEEEFSATVKNFWWDTTYVAKSLWRDELFYAKYIFENIIRFNYLKKIIEWRIGSRSNEKITTNKYGRLFKKYLTPDEWESIEATFAGSNISENWDALFAAMNVFRNFSKDIASKMNFNYPDKLDEEITFYIQKIRDLEKDAKEI